MAQERKKVFFLHKKELVLYTVFTLLSKNRFSFMSGKSSFRFRYNKNAV